MTIAVENKGASPLHLAGFVILPGETRILAKHLVPSHLHPAEEAAPRAPVADPVRELAAKKVGEIREAIISLTDAELDALEGFESDSEKPRAGVMEAITKEKLRRADVREKLQEFDIAVAKMSDDELRGYRENVAQHPELVAVIDTELQARAGG